MKLQRNYLLAALAGLAATALSSGVAQATNIVHFQAAPGPHNYLVTNHPAVLPHLTPAAWVLGSYAYKPLVLRDASGNALADIVTHAGSFDVAAAFGLFDRFELALAASAVYLTGPGFDGNGLTSIAPGDPRVMAKVLLTPWTDGFVASFRLRADLPAAQLLGDTGRLAGENTLPNITPALNIGVSSDAFRLGLDVGYLVRAPSSIGDLRVGHEIVYGAGGEVQLVERTLYATVDLFGRIAPSYLYESFVTEAATDLFPLEVAGALKYHIGPVLLVAGVGTGIVPDYGSPLFRVFVGGGYHPLPDRDRDGDGILDDDDACPDDPEDFDGFEDEDGCPEDNPVGDRDGDGILDDVDKCPDDPEDFDGFEDEDGCPDNDHDGDGILNDDDECPLDPEDFDGFEDEDGCPDNDHDNDDILNDDDQCPDDPEDYDGWEDEDGCPDPDNDQDKILDPDDECPNDPEIYNGFKDDDGCPDGKKVTVIVKRDQIVITDRVYFKFDSDKIKRRSYGLLDRVASVIVDHKEIPVILVAGHTDSVGKAAYNMNLSKRRARSVMRYLVEAGVAEERLRSEGYGLTQPIASNRTKFGRAKNRRVEFRIQRPDASERELEMPEGSTEEQELSEDFDEGLEMPGDSEGTSDLPNGELE